MGDNLMSAGGQGGLSHCERDSRDIKQGFRAKTDDMQICLSDFCLSPSWKMARLVQGLGGEVNIQSTGGGGFVYPKLFI